MRLLDYPGLLGKWPPPAQTAAGAPASLDHCQDSLAWAFYEVPEHPGFTRVRILTFFQGSLFVRELFVSDDIFARVFCEFLNRQKGRTIREIGEMDVTFFG